MHIILQRYIGRSPKVSVSQAAVVVRKAWTQKARERRVRSWLSGQAEPRHSETMALFKLLGEDFTNECLESIGYTGVIRMQGEATDLEARQHVREFEDHLVEYWQQPGNGNEHRLKRKAVKVIAVLRRLVHMPRFKRFKAV